MAVKHFSRPPKGPRQRGFMLIEALIALLIFSIGILGIIGLQASAVKQSTDARYRSEAAQLADQLISQMWTSTDRSPATLAASYNSCGAGCTGYATWLARVKQVLPGVSDDAGSDTAPVVDVSNPGAIVTVRLRWRQPGDDPNEPPHSYNVQAQIGQ